MLAFLRTIAAGCALLIALSEPARAVDRTIGAGVPKPQATGAPWAADDIAGLQHDLDAIVAGPALRNAHVGIVVQTTADDVPLYARNADGAFQSASTMKLLTGSAALERLGRAYRFHTTVERHDAPDPAGVVTTLVVRGGGDPLFGVKDVEDAAAAIARAGVIGPVHVVLDTSHVAPGERHPAGWSVDDVLAYYAPIVNGLPFEENLLHAQIVPGAVGAPPRVVLPAPFAALPVPVRSCREGPTLLTFTVAARTGAAGSASTLDAERGRCGDVVITGVIPAGAPESLDLAVEQPEVLALQSLTGALRSHGLNVRGGLPAFDPIRDVIEGPATPVAPVLWQHDGEPLADLLADLWLPSDNLVAEMLLREMDVVANRHAGTAAGGTAVEAAWLASIGVDPATLTLSDGSGLSQYDRLTPRALVAILRHDWRGPDRDVVLDDLSIAGVRGTLRTQMRGTPAEARVFAKDGEMSHVRGLAGYIATRSHGAVTFALLVDDWIGADAELKAARTALCARLAGA